MCYPLQPAVECYREDIFDLFVEDDESKEVEVLYQLTYQTYGIQNSPEAYMNALLCLSETNPELLTDNIIEETKIQVQNLNFEFEIEAILRQDN